MRLSKVLPIPLVVATAASGQFLLPALTLFLMFCDSVLCDNGARRKCTMAERRCECDILGEGRARWSRFVRCGDDEAQRGWADIYCQYWCVHMLLFPTLTLIFH